MTIAQDPAASVLAKINRSLARSPQNAQLWYRKGKILRFQGRTLESIASFKRAIGISPTIDGWIELGYTSYNDRDYSQARINVQQAAIQDPQSSQAWLNLGNCCAMQGDRIEAIENYDRALTIDPDESLVWQNKGDLYKQMNDIRSARTCYTKARKNSVKK
jgi:tetratricopeptide (TPR) repeat protein